MTTAEFISLANLLREGGYVCEGTVTVFLPDECSTPNLPSEGQNHASPFAGKPLSEHPKIAYERKQQIIGACGPCSGQTARWNKGMKFGLCHMCNKLTYVHPL